MGGLLLKLGFGPKQPQCPGRLRQLLKQLQSRTVEYQPQQVAAFTDSAQNLREQIAIADQRRYSATKRATLRVDLAVLLRKLAASAGGAEGEAKLAEAEQAAREAIALAADVNNVSVYVLALDALSEVFAARNNWPAVEKATEEAQRLAAHSPRPDPLRAAHRVHLLGTARHFNGRPEEAIDALDTALLLHEQTYGPDHLKTSDVLLEIGKVFRSQGYHEAAQDFLRRALRIRRTHLGEATPEAVEVVHHLAMSLHESGNMEGAVEEFERLLVLKELQLGVQNLEELAEIQYSMATYFAEWGMFARARELVTEAVGVFRSTGGVRLAVSLETLGQLEEVRGHYTCALEELEAAGKVWQSLGPNRLRELVRNMEYRADLLEDMCRHEEGAQLRAKARALQEAKAPPLAPTAVAAGAEPRQRTSARG